MTNPLSVVFAEFRKNLGISQREAGEFFTPPIHQAIWSPLERGIRKPSQWMVEQLASLTSNPALLDQYRKECNEPPPPAPSGPPAKQKSAPTNALPAWKWMADLIESVGDPAHVVQTSNEVTLTWASTQPIQALRYQVTLATARGSVSSDVIRATGEIIRKKKVVASVLAETPDTAAMFLFNAMKAEDEKSLKFNRLILGLNAVFAYAAYKETLK